jgi:hypothetical protein
MSHKWDNGPILLRTKEHDGQNFFLKTINCSVRERHESSELFSKVQHCYMFMLYIGYLITPSVSDTIKSLFLCLIKFKFFLLRISPGGLKKIKSQNVKRC